MAVTIKQSESTPEHYPDLGSPSPLSAASAAINLDSVWQRIESHVAHRWTARDVTWIVDGPGEWHPPLAPATVATVETWSRAGEWEIAALEPSPLGGYWLPASGPYRFTATVGGGSPAPELPAVVLEAFRRLAEYFATKPGKPGATSERIGAGSINIRHSRSASWMAEAMQNSGAADLLRGYRHV
jgi:hypothetical protein